MLNTLTSKIWNCLFYDHECHYNIIFVLQWYFYWRFQGSSLGEIMLKMKRLYNQQIYPSEVFVVVADLHYHFSVIKAQRHNSQNIQTVQNFIFLRL